MDTGKKAKLDIPAYTVWIFSTVTFCRLIPMHQTIKDSTLTTEKHFDLLILLNQYSHLDSHASHHELCWKVGNKTHLPSTGTHDFRPPTFLILQPPQQYQADLSQHYFTCQQKTQKLSLPS